MSGICIRCGMLSKSLASNATCPECNANAQHYIGVGEKRMAQAIAELKERNRKQDADIIDMREAIRKRDAEIAALKADIERSNTSRLSEIMANNMVQREQAAEIAALREAVRRTYRLQSDGSVTVTETDGFSEVNADLDGIESAVRRALEERR